jgi:enamine deaminase RidA (YjgF/YER057c/UK114 family)
MSGDIENQLLKLGETLPAAPAAVGAYVPAIRTGQLVVTSGQLPVIGKEVMFKGKVGKEITLEEAQNAARICVLNCLSQIKALVGSLDDIGRIIRVEGFVQSTDDFYNQPQVMNGASELLVAIFGDQGKHARFAVGSNTLPFNAAVEVAIWVELKPGK